MNQKLKEVGFYFFLNLNFAPNLDRGSEILKKSLFDKLLSPINFIGYGVFIKKPRINLPNVPEFSAFSIRFFYTYIHLNLSINYALFIFYFLF